MFYYAITIRKNHKLSSLDMTTNDDNVVDLADSISIVNDTYKNILYYFKNIEYVDVVLHNEKMTGLHVHALLVSQFEITREMAKSYCHLEILFNFAKYETYMYNHDLEFGQKYGSLPFVDSDVKDRKYDEMIQYMFDSRSAKKTVQRFGLMALKYYSALKSLEIDISNGGL